MITRVLRGTLRRIGSDVTSMHIAAYILASFTLLSTLLALVRDRLLASVFGAGAQLDVYYAAFRIPDLIFTVVASMVSVFILIPLLSEYQAQKQRAGFIQTLLLVFGTLLVVVSVVVYVYTPALVEHFFSELVLRGYGSELITLVRILLLQPVLLGISGIASSVIQYHGKYIVYAIAPLLYNLGIIAGVLWCVPELGVIGVGYGVLLGAFMHLLVQLPSFVSLGYVSLGELVSLREVVRVIAVSVPRTVALSLNQLVLFILVALAGTMSEGSIAVFTLAFNLQAAPLSIIGVSYSTAAFPTLSRLHAGGQMRDFANQVISAARHIIFWSLPAVALIVVLRAQIVRVVYGGGVFDWSDTRLTAAAVALFVLSLAAQGVMMLLVRGYYAAGRTVKPLVMTALSAGLTVALAHIFVAQYAQHESLRLFAEALTRTESTDATLVLMLPLAYTVAATLVSALFLLLFVRDFHEGTERMRRTVFESFVGALTMAGVAYVVLQFIASSGFITINTLVEVFAQGALSGIAGIISGAIVLWVIGNREVRTVWKVLHSKLWRRKNNQLLADVDVN